ncbi:MAG: hypothetical protein KTR30_30065 [Saprospiraceae bacterium]|nr:hypothetical protein [Saprospiraceae bacterium]
MKHETTPKSNRKLESSLLIIMLFAGVLGIIYLLNANESPAEEMVIHYDQANPNQAFISIDNAAEVGLPTEISLRDLNPSETYLLVLGKEKTIEVQQAEIQYVFEQSGKHAVQLLEKGTSGYQVIDQFEIEVKTDRTVAAY